ncbi:hypothetical protein [Kitasatospora sp. NPDC057198]|uniref:hypothetical protein n=1 Tax=Kitasatospora sp. NPDC057198 TaxID=3346046 RepID=UPI0036343DD3
MAPTLTTAYLLTDELAAPTERTRAGAWVNTSCNAGSSTATALTGTLLTHLPLPACLLLAATPPLAALALRGHGGEPRQGLGERRGPVC